jgi:hypothetical protein
MAGAIVFQRLDGKADSLFVAGPLCTTKLRATKLYVDLGGGLPARPITEFLLRAV